MQGASLQENGGADARAVCRAEVLDIEYCTFHWLLTLVNYLGVGEIGGIECNLFFCDAVCKVAHSGVYAGNFGGDAQREIILFGDREQDGLGGIFVGIGLGFLAADLPLAVGLFFQGEVVAFGDAFQQLFFTAVAGFAVSSARLDFDFVAF